MAVIELDEQTLRSNRRFGKLLVKMVDEELKGCSPHHVLELEITIIEHPDKPIAQIISENKWQDLLHQRKRRSYCARVEHMCGGRKNAILFFEIVLSLLFVVVVFTLLR